MSPAKGMLSRKENFKKKDAEKLSDFGKKFVRFAGVSCTERVLFSALIGTLRKKPARPILNRRVSEGIAAALAHASG